MTYSYACLSDGTLWSIPRSHSQTRSHYNRGGTERNDRTTNKSDHDPVCNRSSHPFCSHPHPYAFRRSACHAFFSPFDLHSLSLLVLFPFASSLSSLSPFYPTPLSPCMYVPRASCAPPPRACGGCFPPRPSSQRHVTSSVLGSPRVRLFSGFGRLSTGHVTAVIDKRTGWGLMTVSKAHAAECRHITLLRAVAVSLAIKTTLGLAGGREMVFWTAFAASLELGRVPKTYELAGNEGLSGNRSLNKHSRDTNTVENGVRHAVASKGNYSAVVS